MSAEQDAFWMDELIQHVSTPRFVRVSLAPGRNNARHTAKYTHVYVLLNTVNVQGLGLIVSTSAPPFFYFVRLRNKIIFELVNSTQMSMTCCADSSGRFMCELLLLVRSHSHFFRSQGRRNQTDGVFFFLNFCGTIGPTDTAAFGQQEHSRVGACTLLSQAVSFNAAPELSVSSASVGHPEHLDRSFFTGHLKKIANGSEPTRFQTRSIPVSLRGWLVVGSSTRPIRFMIVSAIIGGARVRYVRQCRSLGAPQRRDSRYWVVPCEDDDPCESEASRPKALGGADP
jgi:hypothetical protein